MGEVRTTLYSFSQILKHVPGICGHVGHSIPIGSHEKMMKLIIMENRR